MRGGRFWGVPKNPSREGQEMEKAVFTFEKGHDYLAKSCEENGKIKVYKLHCSQGQGLHYANEKPVFNNGNGSVHVLNLQRMKADDDSMEVQKATVRVYRNHDWSKDLEVLAFPVDMPKFEYENK